MKKAFIIWILAACCWSLPAQEFEKFFTDSTLRLDYVFCGDATHQAIYLQDMHKTGKWAGRRNNLEEPILKGNGQIRVKEPSTGKTLYVNSFSTLFQEWQSYPEAKQVQKAFENCFQVPFPKESVVVEVTLSDVYGRETARMSHPVNPRDILIRRTEPGKALCETLQEGESLPSAIDIVLLAEGYTAAEEEKFFADAARAQAALMAHEPFTGHASAFSIRAVFLPSKDSGPSVPRLGAWHNTLVDSQFDTFYIDRYLTSSAQVKIYDALGTVPFEHIIVLVNTPIYGGGGIFNSLTIMGSDHSTFPAVLVHEFGHAFGGLGDEYFYDDMSESMYPAGVEPWEPNLTTLTDFASKWQDLVPAGTPVPTPVDAIETQADVRRIWKTLAPEQKARLNHAVGIYEGGGYQSKGVYRPVQECRMKINECEDFCPVCTRALERMITFYTR